jgi:hypothetical protein
MRLLPVLTIRARLFLLLFLSLNFLFLLTSSGRVRTRDELSVDLQAESLVTRGSTAIPQAASFFFYGKYDRSGKPQPPYGAAHAALVAPWYVAGRALLAILPGIRPGAKNVVSDAAVVASSATFSALAGALLFLILARLGISNRASLLAALMLGLATPVFSYSSWLYSEPLTAALLLAAVAALFTGGSRPSISPGQAILGGLFLGMALWVRPTHVIAVPVFLAALVIRDRETGWRPALIVGTIVALFGVAYLIRNQYFFGSPFDFGYPEASDGGKNMNSFDTPFFTGFYGFLLSPGKSIFVFAPPILLAIAGTWKLARLDRGLAVVAGITPAVYLFFYSRFTQWEGGFCVGPRYLIPGIALLCLGLGPMLEDAGRWVRRLTPVIFLAGVSVQVITSATSYFEDQANGNYYDMQYNYRMDYSPLVSMSRQLWHYITASQPSPLGLGFDRWFVFLSKAGVARGTILFLLFLEFAGFLFFAVYLVKTIYPKSRTTHDSSGAIAHSRAANY